MIPEINIISRKASITSVNRTGFFGGALNLLVGGFKGHSPLRKLLGSEGIEIGLK